MEKTDNRTVGGKFEQTLAEELFRHGFWAHVMQQNKAGQPADIIAAKGRFHTLIDCKVVSDDDGFPFSRVEENQRLAMKQFQRKCGELCYFAIRLPDMSVWFVSLGRIETLECRGKKRLTEDEIREKEAWSMEKWMDASDTWAEDV